MKQFAERNGYVKPRPIIVETIEIKLKTRLWNFFAFSFVPSFPTTAFVFVNNMNVSVRIYILRDLWSDFLCRPIDEMQLPNQTEESVVSNFVKNWIINEDWLSIFDFLEYLLSKVARSGVRLEAFESELNAAFQKENYGYRVIDGIICQTTSEIESAELSSIGDIPDKFSAAREHLQKALVLFSRREGQDFSGSIHESVNAFESAAKASRSEGITDYNKALAKLVEEGKLPKGIRSAIASLYSYASENGGIRHGKTEGELDPNADEAKFMLVTCTSIVNYIVSISN